MNFGEPMMWYMDHERQQEQSRRRNQNILQKQLFQRAEQRGIISIEPNGTVTVLDVPAAMHHFSHHPDLVDLAPVLGWALNGDVAKLGPALSEAWRQITYFRG